MSVGQSMMAKMGFLAFAIILVQHHEREKQSFAMNPRQDLNYHMESCSTLIIWVNITTVMRMPMHSIGILYMVCIQTMNRSC